MAVSHRPGQAVRETGYTDVSAQAELAGRIQIRSYGVMLKGGADRHGAGVGPSSMLTRPLGGAASLARASGCTWKETIMDAQRFDTWTRRRFGLGLGGLGAALLGLTR